MISSRVLTFLPNPSLTASNSAIIIKKCRAWIGAQSMVCFQLTQKDSGVMIINNLESGLHIVLVLESDQSLTR